MLKLFDSKTKLQAYNIQQVSIEKFEIYGVGQVNPYCQNSFENDIFLTLVNFSNESKEFDEREGFVLSKYFTLRKCPRCKKIELVPSKIRINKDRIYLKHEEEIAFDAFEEIPHPRRFPSTVQAYCTGCASCFEIRIKSSDLWIKEAKKVKEKDVVKGYWEEYQVD